MHKSFPDSLWWQRRPNNLYRCVHLLYFSYDGMPYYYYHSKCFMYHLCLCGFLFIELFARQHVSLHSLNTLRTIETGFAFCMALCPTIITTVRINQLDLLIAQIACIVVPIIVALLFSIVHMRACLEKAKPKIVANSFDYSLARSAWWVALSSNISRATGKGFPE